MEVPKAHLEAPDAEGPPADNRPRPDVPNRPVEPSYTGPSMIYCDEGPRRYAGPNVLEGLSIEV